MGFEDRHYRQASYGGGNPAGRTGFFLPGITPMVKYLLIINVVVHIIQSLTPGSLESWFAASGHPVSNAFQLWRLVTFQFLHGSPGHLLFNMIGLYFLGVILERAWGSRQFLKFYLVTGAVGGFIYVLASCFGAFQDSLLVGASGGVLALMVGCAILFPQMKLLVFFILPVSIRVIASFLVLAYFFNVIQEFNNPASNAGGDLCHLGGMITGFFWVMARPYLAGLQQQRQQGSFEHKHQQQANQQYEVDRILAKVHEKGIQSLTRNEKKTLQQATDSQKQNTPR